MSRQKTMPSDGRIWSIYQRAVSCNVTGPDTNGWEKVVPLSEAEAKVTAKVREAQAIITSLRAERDEARAVLRGCADERVTLRRRIEQLEGADYEGEALNLRRRVAQLEGALERIADASGDYEAKIADAALHPQPSYRGGGNMRRGGVPRTPQPTRVEPFDVFVRRIAPEHAHIILDKLSEAEDCMDGERAIARHFKAERDKARAERADAILVAVRRYDRITELEGALERAIEEWVPVYHREQAREALASTPQPACGACRGTGKLQRVRDRKQVVEPCPRCDGTGDRPLPTPQPSEGDKT